MNIKPYKILVYFDLIRHGLVALTEHKGGFGIKSNNVEFDLEYECICVRTFQEKRNDFYYIIVYNIMYCVVV